MCVVLSFANAPPEFVIVMFKRAGCGFFSQQLAERVVSEADAPLVAFQIRERDVGQLVQRVIAVALLTAIQVLLRNELITSSQTNR